MTDFRENLNFCNQNEKHAALPHGEKSRAYGARKNLCKKIFE
jgi:hypothetical protein